MGFYGKISNTSKTQFTFDRTYPNRKTMDACCSDDGVYIGRYVLIEYDACPTNSCVLANRTLKDYPDNAFEDITLYLWKVDGDKYYFRTVEYNEYFKVVSITEDEFSNYYIKISDTEYAKAEDFDKTKTYYSRSGDSENGYTYNIVNSPTKENVDNYYIKTSKETYIKPTTKFNKENTYYSKNTDAEGKVSFEKIESPTEDEFSNYYIKTNSDYYTKACSYDENCTYYILTTYLNSTYLPNYNIINKTIKIPADHNAEGTGLFYFIVKAQHIDSNGAVYYTVESLTELSEIYDEAYYSTNYAIDKEYKASGRGYDSTVWQKTYGTAPVYKQETGNKNWNNKFYYTYNEDTNSYSLIKEKDYNGTEDLYYVTTGGEHYVMIAELNTVVPTFTLSADAPTAEPSIPHFGKSTTNVSYDLHWQPNWGFRLRPANPENDLDENGSGVDEDKNGIILKSTENDIYPSDVQSTYTHYEYDEETQTLKAVEDQEDVPYDAAVYWNNAGFDSSTIAYYNPKTKHSNGYEKNSLIENNKIELTPTGVSGRQYNNHKQGEGYFTTAADIQELKIQLPGLGDAVAEMWDLVYGNYKQNDNSATRNRDVDWASPMPENYLKYEVNGTEISGYPDGLRMVKVDTSSKSDRWTYDTEKVETLAGAINSVHDLMGMIIVNLNGTIGQGRFVDQYVAVSEGVSYSSSIKYYTYEIDQNNKGAYKDYTYYSQVESSAAKEEDFNKYYIKNNNGKYEKASGNFNSETIYYLADAEWSQKLHDGRIYKFSKSGLDVYFESYADDEHIYYYNGEYYRRHNGISYIKVDFKKDYLKTKDYGDYKIVTSSSKSNFDSYYIRKSNGDYEKASGSFNSKTTYYTRIDFPENLKEYVKDDEENYSSTTDYYQENNYYIKEDNDTYTKALGYEKDTPYYTKDGESYTLDSSEIEENAFWYKKIALTSETYEKDKYYIKSEYYKDLIEIDGLYYILRDINTGELIENDGNSNTFFVVKELYLKLEELTEEEGIKFNPEINHYLGVNRIENITSDNWNHLCFDKNTNEFYLLDETVTYNTWENKKYFIEDEEKVTYSAYDMNHNRYSISAIYQITNPLSGDDGYEEVEGLKNYTSGLYYYNVAGNYYLDNSEKPLESRTYYSKNYILSNDEYDSSITYYQKNEYYTLKDGVYVKASSFKANTSYYYLNSESGEYVLDSNVNKDNFYYKPVDFTNINYENGKYYISRPENIIFDGVYYDYINEKATKKLWYKQWEEGKSHENYKVVINKASNSDSNYTQYDPDAVYCIKETTDKQDITIDTDKNQKMLLAPGAYYYKPMIPISENGLTGARPDDFYVSVAVSTSKQFEQIKDKLYVKSDLESITIEEEVYYLYVSLKENDEFNLNITYYMDKYYYTKNNELKSYTWNNYYSGNYDNNGNKKSETSIPEGLLKVSDSKSDANATDEYLSVENKTVEDLNNIDRTGQITSEGSTVSCAIYRITDIVSTDAYVYENGRFVRETLQHPLINLPFYTPNDFSDTFTGYYKAKAEGWTKDNLCYDYIYQDNALAEEIVELYTNDYWEYKEVTSPSESDFDNYYIKISDNNYEKASGNFNDSVTYYINNTTDKDPAPFGKNFEECLIYNAEFEEQTIYDPNICYYELTEDKNYLRLPTGDSDNENLTVKTGVEDVYYRIQDGDFTLEPNFYSANKYYYNANEYEIVPDAEKSKTAFDNGKYYTFNSDTGKYDPATGIYDASNNTSYYTYTSYVKDSSSEMTDGRTYYNKLTYCVKSSQDDEYSVGEVWDNNLWPIPNGIDIGKIKYTSESQVMTSFARSYNTIHGLLLRTLKLLEDSDDLTRDSSTVQGAINKLNDMIRHFGALNLDSILKKDKWVNIDGHTYNLAESEKPVLSYAKLWMNKGQLVLNSSYLKDLPLKDKNSEDYIVDGNIKGSYTLEQLFKGNKDDELIPKIAMLNSDAFSPDRDGSLLYLDNKGNLSSTTLIKYSLNSGKEILSFDEHKNYYIDSDGNAIFDNITGTISSNGLTVDDAHNQVIIGSSETNYNLIVHGQSDLLGDVNIGANNNSHNLHVYGTATIEGATTLGSGLAVRGGNTTLRYGLTVYSKNDNDAEVSALEVNLSSGLVTAKKGLTVNGSTTLNSGLTVKGGDLVVSGTHTDTSGNVIANSIKGPLNNSLIFSGESITWSATAAWIQNSSTSITFGANTYWRYGKDGYWAYKYFKNQTTVTDTGGTEIEKYFGDPCPGNLPKAVYQATGFGTYFSSSNDITNGKIYNKTFNNGSTVDLYVSKLLYEVSDEGVDAKGTKGDFVGQLGVIY